MKWLKKGAKWVKGHMLACLFWILIFFLFFLIPCIINSFFMKWHLPTAGGLGNAEWLGFWGSYIGSFLGILVTLGSFYWTYRQNEKFHRQNRQSIEEERRLSVLPIIQFDIKVLEKLPFNIDVDCFSFGDELRYYPRTVPLSVSAIIPLAVNIPFSIKMRNIGRESLIRAHIVYHGKECSIDNIPRDGQIACLFLFSIPDEKASFTILIRFFDVKGLKYEQRLSFIIDRYGEHKIATSYYPCLVESPDDTSRA